MKPITVLLTAAIALAAFPAFAQKPVAPKKVKVPAVATPAKVEVAPHVTGMVKKPGAVSGKFSIGSGTKKTRGTWTIDASSATVAKKDGTAVDIATLSPGSNVSVFGMIDAKTKTVKAEKVQVNFLRIAKVKAVKAPKAPKVPKAVKPKGGVTPVAPPKVGGGN